MPDESNPYLQSSLSVVIAPSTNSLVGGIGDFNNSLSASFNPCPRPLIGKERWVFEGFGLWLRHLVISPIGLLRDLYLKQYLGHDPGHWCRKSSIVFDDSCTKVERFSKEILAKEIDTIFQR